MRTCPACGFEIVEKLAGPESVTLHGREILFYEATGVVQAGKAEARLTRAEMAIFARLARARGATVENSKLIADLEFILGTEYSAPGPTLNAYALRLREKLEPLDLRVVASYGQGRLLAWASLKQVAA